MEWVIAGIIVLLLSGACGVAVGRRFKALQKRFEAATADNEELRSLSTDRTVDALLKRLEAMDVEITGAARDADKALRTARTIQARYGADRKFQIESENGQHEEEPPEPPQFILPGMRE